MGGQGQDHFNALGVICAEDFCADAVLCRRPRRTELQKIPMVVSVLAWK